MCWEGVPSVWGAEVCWTGCAVTMGAEAAISAGPLCMRFSGTHAALTLILPRTT